MFKCPNCGKQTISAWDKVKLMIVDKAQCKECGTRLAAPKSTLILNIMFAAVLIFPEAATNYVKMIRFTNIFVWISTLILFFVVNIFFIPLVKRESK